MINSTEDPARIMLIDEMSVFDAKREGGWKQQDPVAGGT